MNFFRDVAVTSDHQLMLLVTQHHFSLDQFGLKQLKLLFNTLTIESLLAPMDYLLVFERNSC